MSYECCTYCPPGVHDVDQDLPHTHGEACCEYIPPGHYRREDPDLGEVLVKIPAGSGTSEPGSDELLLVHRPGRAFGRVTIGHSRLPARTILELLRAGDAAELIQHAYPQLSPAQLRVLDQLRRDLDDQPSDKPQEGTCDPTGQPTR